MSNATLDLMYRHRSIRKFAPDPIPRETIETIVEAGQRASTSSNMQYYSAIVLTDPAKKARMATLCGDQEQIRQAPVFIAWCADRSRLARASEQRGYKLNSDYVEAFLVAAVDVGIMMQNAMLAAESLGYGCCYIGAIRNDTQAVIDLLELPQLVFPISGMTLGVPADNPIVRPRLATEAVLHWEHYDASDEQQLLEAYDKAMVATGIYDGRQVAVPGKPGEVEDYGWREHSARRLAQPRRTELREVLARQGFGLK
ncbi:MAG: NADPH-dependent oxidoreductase [Candidatus Tectimicrobiota bacterium]